MRLWHKDLIDVLPDKQLISQWRECCAIVKAIAEKGTPNHILVNKVCQYPPNHLYSYTRLVLDEMSRRGFTISPRSYQNFSVNIENIRYSHGFGPLPINVPFNDLFAKWHNIHYLTQCFCNLEEKHDCGGITDEDWEKIKHRYFTLIRDSDEIRRVNRYGN